MKIQMIEEQDLESASPRNIRLYLSSHGWERRSGHTSESIAGPDVWSLDAEEGTYEVIAPSSRSAKDFTRRVAEIVRTLAIVEERSELELWRDLVTVDFDIQYIHTQSALTSGTAPLRDVSDALAGALAMFSASTSSLEEPRLVLPSRRSSDTTRLMQNVRAGPTSEGSYIISILVPLPPKLTPEEDSVLFEVDDEPFPRRATRHLHKALVATKRAATRVLEQDDGLLAFEESKDSGVSANLCEALATISGQDDRPFEVHFAWSLDRPVTIDEPTVTFDDETIPVLKEAARELRNKVPEDEVRLRGNVIRLHREGQLGNGDVTVAGTLIGDPSEKLLRVSLNLAQPDYTQAIQAHEGFRDIEVVGSLVRRGTRMSLSNVREFEITSNED